MGVWPCCAILNSGGYELVDVVRCEDTCVFSDEVSKKLRAFEESAVVAGAVRRPLRCRLKSMEYRAVIVVVYAVFRSDALLVFAYLVVVLCAGLTVFN